MGCSNVQKDQTVQSTPQQNSSIPQHKSHKLEQAALDFVDVTFIHPNEKKAKSYMDPELLKTKGDSLLKIKLLSGKIKIASRIDEKNKFAAVRLFFSSALSNKNPNILRIALQEINGKIIVKSCQFDFHSPTSKNFEEFKKSEYWNYKGHLLSWRDITIK
jgi:hypothetical protein